jgi:hypothetical protein
MGKMCWELHYKNPQNDQRRKYTNNHYKPKVLNFKKKGERERERESQTRLKPSSQTLQNLNKAKDKPWGEQEKPKRRVEKNRETIATPGTLVLVA